jgi:hypothetical protein
MARPVPMHVNIIKAENRGLNILLIETAGESLPIYRQGVEISAAFETAMLSFFVQAPFPFGSRSFLSL